ncbi:hypothetical protein Poli38472_012519 [Pythium oligandrum]|uniref:subtilisin n=1 Tax=Pythium oligandrum TaxID=41045 RepID=A0A8K1CEZ5_PYTOL|nr:hypothetical protein Poli38472_012519 [Pythium oligandrum]|eukprot:TMW61328.1 hypothetical protein Poli38472_012519 [Pythium oligandrum]
MAMRLRALWTLLAVATRVAATQEFVTDSQGLVFASTEAFCALHCTPFRRQRALTQCDTVRCPQYRRLASEEEEQGQVHADDGSNSIARVSVLSCGDVASPQHLSFAIDADASNDDHEQRNVFRGFHEAFFGAFDAMFTSANATYEACQLALIQQELLPNTTTNSSSADEEATIATAAPMLVKILRDADQRECVGQIRSIWSHDEEEMTPFLSRKDETSKSTVLLVHIPTTVAVELNALDCVDSVVALPTVLKLLPFARSAMQLSQRKVITKAPAMEVRLVKGSDRKAVYQRLQSKLQALSGVTNVFDLREGSRLASTRPRSLWTMAVEQLDLWSLAVGVAVEDVAVEWVDVHSEMSLNAFRHTRYMEAMGVSRRLDEFVESLVGVEDAQQRGIRGNGIVVGITDSGLYIDHDQFDQVQRDVYTKENKEARKVVLYNAWANAFDESEEIVCGHGTHVAGLLAGSSYSGKNPNIGIASDAKIAFMDIGEQNQVCTGQKNCPVSLATPAEASQLLQSQMEVGARIFSFSWGTPGSDYSVQARDLDAFIYENPEVLIIVAAGNSGEESTTGYSTISSPSGAKNVISVGASLNSAESFTQTPCPNVFNPYSVASFSSAGPTTDGRMKPDVVAPGMSLISSQSLAPGLTTKTSETCSLQGTSQATPVVTGLAVLLYQWLKEGWWHGGVKDSAYAMETIPAALLKALIIHSSDTLQRRLAPFPSGPVSCMGIEQAAFRLSYPDMYQGYGKPNMSNIADFTSNLSVPTLYFLPNSTKDSDPRVAHEKEVKISFTVPHGVDLRATLVWTDPPGSIRATKQLQHDLDLTVQIRNTSKTFYPLTADNSTNRDDKNNVEMVQVSYHQLVDALKDEPNSQELIGPSGEIIVEAIIYGRSVLLANSQAFAFVASSSVIGTASGLAADSASSSPSSKSFWTPYTIGGVALGALLLLLVLSSCMRCCGARRRRAARPRGPPGVIQHQQPPPGGYYGHGTPHRGPTLQNCPFCAYTCADPVVMVNHVENMHNGGNGPAGNGNFGFPTVQATPPPPSYGYHHPHQAPHAAAPVGRASAHTRPDEQCPYCSFASSDAVLLVNHVERMHGQ